ncbi:hypothetical protein H0H81_003577 [Sphagnurus paluster]|uniref:HSF-type DNA-binding domain-containing protein n=1 Tax=Sphagnurus paluster TaxID=117069 RepID=A0A9P7GMH2_9AGAR|nr:hypothetical protein H0H81_003577 [Sphagnurus paluster]
MSSHLDANYSMNNDYQRQQQQQQWAPHLLNPDQQHYPPFYDRPMVPPRSSLSLNLSSLSVTSPSNLSPINPSPGASSALSPSTPISPSSNPFNPHIQASFQFDSQNSSYDEHSTTAQPTQSSQSSPYDTRRTPGPSRTSSATSSSSHLARKRSFTSTPVLEEPLMYDDSRDAPMDLAAPPYDDIDMRYPSPTSTAHANGTASPVDPSTSAGSSGEDHPQGPPSQIGVPIAGLSGVGGSMNVLGKPMATNNFVTKLYHAVVAQSSASPLGRTAPTDVWIVNRMISDAKSSHYIAWTDLGTSFVVSNVGEFSRSILGSHFKHNNFSSFVRQLNMYGFHKINRTPRAQRTSTDAQTWEFSHHKFLRGRPDLLDEIKRKALEPDPAVKHRVELPGEVAAQLGAMREENRRVWEQLSAERKRSERLVGLLNRLWDTFSTRFPGSMPPFPTDILEYDSPNIYVTSPAPAPAGSTSSSRGFPPLNTNLGLMHAMHSPSTSPTQPDFPVHHPHHHNSHVSQHHIPGQHHPHAHAHAHQGPPPPLSRQHSFQHHHPHVSSYLRSDAVAPVSPGGSSSTMDLFDDTPPDPGARLSSKRPRMSSDDDSGTGTSASTSNAGTNPTSASSACASPASSKPDSALASPGPGVQQQGKKLSRARSDSAPLGYGFGLAGWGGVGRPRSGSGLAGRGVPNIGSAARAGISAGLGGVLSVPSNAPNR